ncbi:MAG TPA: substrate-binding domain-containing protein [Vicinamibacterales bacterium]|jgi:molybdate transport system substrate-binding protein|nr:substrate-binding domain-containing protein [Vicinamibacterales bacterium]
MRYTICAILVAASVVRVAAAELSVLATAAAQGPVQALDKALQQPKQAAKVQFDTSPNIAKRLAAGETPDVLIAQAATVDQLIKDGRALAATRTPVGRIGVGVGIGRGARRPDISTVDALKAALLQADAVVYSRGASGLLVEQLLRKIGVADQISSKVVQLPTGDDVMQRLGMAKGNQIGFTMVSEIKLGESHGGSFVGPLPAAVQTYTAYDAVVMSGSPSPDAARAVVHALATPAARQVFTAAGWEF